MQRVKCRMLSAVCASTDRRICANSEQTKSDVGTDADVGCVPGYEAQCCLALHYAKYVMNALIMARQFIGVEITWK